MVFYPPNDSRYFIKRVIGLPGDHIKIVNKVLYINGVKAEQTLLEGPASHPAYQLLEENLDGTVHQMQKSPYKQNPFDNMSLVVKKDHYFMMGDNRDNSSDSRVWGEVPSHNIVGQAVGVWMTWEKLTSLPRFDRVGSIQ